MDKLSGLPDIDRRLTDVSFNVKSSANVGAVGLLLPTIFSPTLGPVTSAPLRAASHPHTSDIVTDDASLGDELFGHGDIEYL